MGNNARLSSFLHTCMNMFPNTHTLRTQAGRERDVCVLHIRIFKGQDNWNNLPIHSTTVSPRKYPNHYTQLSKAIHIPSLLPSTSSNVSPYAPQIQYFKNTKISKYQHCPVWLHLSWAFEAIPLLTASFLESHRSPHSTYIFQWVPLWPSYLLQDSFFRVVSLHKHCL